MIRKEREGLEWLEFEQFQEFPTLIHGVFTRSCDFSKFGVQKQVEELFGLSSSSRTHLTHGKDVVWMPKSSIPTCDGMVTRTPNLGLVVTHADCQAALFYDPIERVIANVHCGWRGNVQNIYAETVEVLKVQAGCKPENLLVCISPSLGPSHSEFIHFKAEWPSCFWQYQIRPCYFDLWEIARDQLQDAGVLSHHIEIAKICTYANEAQFFSYRRDKKTGRHGTVMSMRNVL